MTKKKNDNWRYDFVGVDMWKLDKAAQGQEDALINRIDNSLLEEVDNSDLHKAIESLEPKLREIVWSLYFEGETLKSYGEKKGYSKQYSHQLRNKAIAKLREVMSNDN